MTVYDKAKWHSEGDFPKGLSPDQAFVHTGMFLGWIIDNNLYNKKFFEQMGLINIVEQFRQRKVTGAEVYKQLDGSLTEEDLNEVGNRFARYYFDSKNWIYIDDYQATLGKGLPSLYDVSDTWENFEKIKNVIDARFDEWTKVPANIV